MDMGWRMYMKIVILERNSVGLDIRWRASAGLVK